MRYQDDNDIVYLAVAIIALAFFIAVSDSTQYGVRVGSFYERFTKDLK